MFVNAYYVLFKKGFQELNTEGDAGHGAKTS